MVVQTWSKYHDRVRVQEYTAWKTTQNCGSLTGTQLKPLLENSGLELSFDFLFVERWRVEKKLRRNLLTKIPQKPQTTKQNHKPQNKTTNHKKKPQTTK
jgi:hypothetical protein